MKKANSPVIKLIKLTTLKPYADNAKVHPESQILKIAASIKAFGWDVPIVANKSGVIIKGHGRYLAAKKLNLKQVPCIIVDLSPEDEMASRIADNKVGESEWDDDLLKGEIENLLEGDYDINLLGFDPGEIDNILQGWVSDLDNENDIEEADLKSKPDKEIYVTCPKCSHKFKEN